MAEAVVSFVLERVGDFATQEAKFLSGVSHQVEVAQTELQLMQGFLKDCRCKTRTRCNSTSLGLPKLEMLLMIWEDVIETYGLKVASKKKRGIKNILRRFACIFREGVPTEIGGESFSQLHERQRLLRRTYSHVIERDVVGLEYNVEELVMHLVKDENRHRVVSVWGMGGLGKTTLARQVYHHKNVRQHFDSFAWVCVSQRCEIRNVWEGVFIKLVSATKEQRQDIKEMTYDEIAKKLFCVMQEMRCLVILDDIWSIETWNFLNVAFPNEQTESTILLTTRYEAVALPPNRNCFLHKLQPLNENESLALLEKIAIFGRPDIGAKRFQKLEGPISDDRKFSNIVEHLEMGVGINLVEPTKSADSNHSGIYSKMRELGRKLLRHCAGLPLAIIVLAGVLSTKNTIKQWEMVNENVYAYIRRGRGHEQEYEGHYPEDREISVSTLTKLWMAEGLISLRQQRQSLGETMENIAHNCLTELVERCVVQVGRSGSTGTIKTCQIHDLIRDLCLLKAEEESFLQIGYSLQENKATNPVTSSMVAKATPVGKIRRLAIYLDENADRLVSSRDETNGHVRSLLYFVLGEWRPRSEKVLLSPLTDFKVLRVLKVEDVDEVEVELPSEIGNMVHLRFLSVRDSKIKRFPSSLASGNLKLSTLGHLQTLDFLSSEYCDLNDVAGLTNLLKLQIRLSLPLENLEEILKSVGSTLNRIQSLLVYNGYYSVRNTSYEEQGNQIVSSCRHIYKLKLDGPTAELPKELHSYPNLTKLELCSCSLKDDQMGILENLPNLTTLLLISEVFEENTKILVFSKGGFPSLQFLSVFRMDEITEWRVEEGAMPSLWRLRMGFCSGLTTLPDGLTYLTNLKELTIFGMPRELHSRIQEDGEDFCKIQHVPSVVIGEPYDPPMQ
ncbi:Disease resistance protein CC-NBS-LRR class family [Prunus dulcis]|uniref:Disease resistance protein CC-NBS-LRR class family n=1 Tax=Prunus dulcis TaxID=3755 RepID=A0A4Y1QL84_PRUDU|nr:Disease resistance protein CC-NBS-LRR class family [Prunus dulcis]